MQPKISVIITIHNAERYLYECLDSVCGQSFEEIEILCIDGGSTDSSPQILSKYAKEDPRIRIINDPNTSYGHKVNVGIDLAKGEYISVLESDDYYEKNMLENLWLIVEKYHPDMVNGEYEMFWDVHGIRFHLPHQMYCKQPYGQLIYNAQHTEDMEIMDRFWTGIFRREFIQQKGIRLNESPGASFQDMSFRFLLSVLAETTYHLPTVVYQYRMDNPGSSMKDPSKTVVIAEEHAYLQQELEKRCISDKNIWYLRYYWKYMDFYGNIHRLQGPGREALFERYQRELKADWEQKVLVDYSPEKYPFADRQILENPDDYRRKIERDFQDFCQYTKRQQILLEKFADAKKIVIFGSGQIGRLLLRRELAAVRERICCFADNSPEKIGTVLDGVEIISPNQAVERNPDALFCIANKKYGDEMKQQLKDYGILEEQIICYC